MKIVCFYFMIESRRTAKQSFRLDLVLLFLFFIQLANCHVCVCWFDVRLNEPKRNRKKYWRLRILQILAIARSTETTNQRRRRRRKNNARCKLNFTSISYLLVIDLWYISFLFLLSLAFSILFFTRREINELSTSPCDFWTHNLSGAFADTSGVHYICCFFFFFCCFVQHETAKRCFSFILFFRVHAAKCKNCATEILWNKSRNEANKRWRLRGINERKKKKQDEK